MYFITCIFISFDCDEKHASKPRFIKKERDRCHEATVFCLTIPWGMGWSLKLYPNSVVTWNITVQFSNSNADHEIISINRI